MKNSIFLLVFSVFWQSSSACSWWDPDYEYYNLFVQTSINSPVYDPFLLTESMPFYESDAAQNIPNENIEDWQNYFGISYEQAYYLVFIASRESVDALAKGKTTNDKKLGFADSNFRTKFKQALLYLAYAKYLEPYMAYKRNSDADSYYWGFLPEKTVADLDYKKVTEVLTKSWNAETDKDLKLRYGYQLVRFAHYYHKFREAINYFNLYVESLNHKGIMYYYALDQKGGAERALGNFMQANYDFFQFFTHTKNNKSLAYNSMKMTQDLDFQAMLRKPMSNDEKFDLYMLMGYHSFNNPLAEMKKIVAISPDAVQAKVLMARAVNQLERSMLPVYYNCPYDGDDAYDPNACFNNLKDNKLPIVLNSQISLQLKEALESSLAQTKNAKEKNFWNLTTAYLYFLNKDYQLSKEFLNKVNASDKTFGDQKNLFTMLLDIVEQPVISADFEKSLLTRYKEFFANDKKTGVDEDGYFYETGNSTKDFVFDILANRYYLQKDNAKSFLLQNSVSALEYNPDLNLLNAIEDFYFKKNKNEFEIYLLNKLNADFVVDAKLKNDVVYDFESWAANFKGTLALAKADFQTALMNFKKVNPKFALRAGLISYDDDWSLVYKKGIYNGFSGISSRVFGFNKIECFSCPESMVMQADFLNEFPFIKNKMNKAELAEAIIELDKIAKQNGEQAAKANYLLSNFYFNTTTIGYFRELLTFDIDNSNGEKFHSEDFGQPSVHFYYKDYSTYPYYRDQFELPLNYAEAALSKAGSDELKARILFTASKSEQGLFYKKINENPEAFGQDSWWLDYDSPAIMALKVKDYRKYFKALKSYSNTAFYKEVKSNCKYFNYYSNHY